MWKENIIKLGIPIWLEVAYLPGFHGTKCIKFESAFNNVPHATLYLRCIYNHTGLYQMLPLFEWDVPCPIIGGCHSQRVRFMSMFIHLPTWAMTHGDPRSVSGLKISRVQVTTASFACLFETSTTNQGLDFEESSCFQAPREATGGSHTWFNHGFLHQRTMGSPGFLVISLP